MSFKSSKQEISYNRKSQLDHFRQEADYINNLYGISDEDHATLEPGHIYFAMRLYAHSNPDVMCKCPGLDAINRICNKCSGIVPIRT